ncbi:hypothetical protein SS05631_b49770 (plasmid) [Sinorhizobium sp. CCBAU 05631]|nr:hypothetical protein SS05631_b49770 [Sinorhizobium sp. CCBAU 05631]
MPAIAAVLQQRQHQLGGKSGTAETGGDLQIGERLDPLAGRDDEAAAHRRRQRLRKAADMHHPLEPFEGGKPRRRRLFEIGKNVVLDDRQSRLVGELQEAVGDKRRERRAGRIVEGGIGDVEARPVFFERRGKALDVRPGRRIGNADDFCLMRPEQRMKVEVARIVDEHGSARLDEEAAEEVDRLGAGLRQHDLLRRGFDAVLRQTAGKERAERQEPERRAVVDERRGTCPRDRPQGPAQPLFRHPFGRQPAAARLQHIDIRLERLPRDPQGIDLALHPRAEFGKRQGG